MRRINLLITVCFVPMLSVFAQDHGVVNHQRVPANTAYHRVWVVSPLIGTGKVGDPKRSPCSCARACADATASEWRGSFRL